MYPTYGELMVASDEQIEEWFMTLPQIKTRREAIKWTYISKRYYLGDESDNPEGENY